MAIDTIKATAILDGAVDTADLTDGAVTTAKIDDSQVTTAKIADDAVTTVKIEDGAVSLDKLSATGTKDGTTFLRGDNSFQEVSVTPTAVSDQSNTSTGYFDMPTGTTAQRPTGSTGMIRFNTTLNTPEYHNGNEWLGFNETAFISPSEIAVTPTVFPNGGDYNTTYNDTYYYGARTLITNGDGTAQFNDYEYGMDAKFNIRSNSNNDSFIQIYDWNGSTPTSFNASAENFFQIGLTWVSDVTIFAQTNTHEATSQLTSGNGAWCCSQGVGSYTWWFYNGGANDNSPTAGATNREGSESLTWNSNESPPLTIVARGDTHPISPRTISLYFGDTLQYTWTQTIPSGSSYLHPYMGIGYPSGNDVNWAYGQPKMRYGELTDGTRFAAS